MIIDQAKIREVAEILRNFTATDGHDLRRQLSPEDRQRLGMKTPSDQAWFDDEDDEDGDYY